jgi:hypothetical protein
MAEAGDGHVHSICIAYYQERGHKVSGEQDGRRWEAALGTQKSNFMITWHCGILILLAYIGRSHGSLERMHQSISVSSYVHFPLTVGWHVRMTSYMEVVSGDTIKL